MHSAGLVIWLTGLSGAGKTTLSNRLADQLRSEGVPVLQIDGDVLRQRLSADLGFTEEDRAENVRRAAAIAAIAAQQGLVAICSLISPVEAQRRLARETAEGVRFLEVFVRCDVETCVQRDPKNLYARALRGEIANFTGISAGYEEPVRPDLVIDTTLLDRDASANLLVSVVRGNLVGS